MKIRTALASPAGTASSSHHGSARRVVALSVALLAAAGSLFAGASPASADLLSDIQGGTTVGGTSQGWTAPQIFARPGFVGCNRGARRLDIDMFGGNQRNYTVHVWTQTWTGTWGAFSYRGSVNLADDMSSYSSGPDITVPSTTGSHVVWVRVVYPSGAISYDGYVQVSKYMGTYGYSQSAAYNGICTL